MTDCQYCKQMAETETGGCAYYRDCVKGKWQSVPICLPCLKEKEPRFWKDWCVG